MPDIPLKISCRKCGQHLDLSLLEPFSEFHCPRCGESGIVPCRFEQYWLERRLGHGGMAEVFLAREGKDGAAMAIKIRNPGLAMWEAVCLKFQYECDTLSRIDHPNVLKLFRWGTGREKVFLCMEYMENGDVETLLRNSKLPPLSRRMMWLAQAASGLADLSQSGLVHHDVKPGNLLLDSGGNIKIGDFDLLSDAPAPGKDAGEVYGSPDYVSPERLISGCEDVRGDIFSLGATAYELLTGRCPFSRGKNEAEMLRMRQDTVPVPPRERQPEIPEPVSRLISAMLSFSPENRPGYAEIVRLFSQYAETEPKAGGAEC